MPITVLGLTPPPLNSDNLLRHSPVSQAKPVTITFKESTGSMDGLSKNALCPGMHGSKNAVHSIAENLEQNAFILFCFFLYENAVRI